MLIAGALPFAVSIRFGCASSALISPAYSAGSGSCELRPMSQARSARTLPHEFASVSQALGGLEKKEGGYGGMQKSKNFLLHI